MKDFYSEFVKYSLQTCSKEDYYYKPRVWKNNRAVTKMLKMSSELIASDRENAGETLFKLMNHENEKVRLNAATICLQKDLYKSDARDVLRRIAKESSDGIISFQASTALKIY